MKTGLQKTTSCLAISALLMLAAATAQGDDVREIEWIELMPQEDLELLQNMPEIEHSGNDPAELPQELLEGNTVSEFENQRIKLPGFVVPLEYEEDQRVTEFFFVPYYGACIHVPPPPPNQIVHVTYEEGFYLDALYEPFYIKGTLKTDRISNEVAEASYVMDAEDVWLYQ